jgi:Zn-dependent protease with chaperone function
MGTTNEVDVEELRSAIWPDTEPRRVRVVSCRHCDHPNRVGVAEGALTPERVMCGRCKNPLFIGRDEPFYGLTSEAYQHGLDRRSLAALQALPGIPQMIRWMYERVGDRAAQLAFLSDSIRCSEEQFPELLAVVDRARKRIDMQEMPEVFLGESPYMNAMTTGVSKATIVVHSALLDQMGDDELLAILGHELGHLHANHPLYLGVANALVSGGLALSSAVRLLSLPIQRLLLRWLRHAELTADRAALLTSRNLRACIGVMLTFAGGNRPGTARRTRIRLGPFIRQCRDLAKAQVGFSADGIIGGYLTADRTHPHVAARVNHLIQWVEHGTYLPILAGQYRRHRRRRAPARAPLALPQRVMIEAIDERGGQ